MTVESCLNGTGALSAAFPTSCVKEGKRRIFLHIFRKGWVWLTLCRPVRICYTLPVILEEESRRMEKGNLREEERRLRNEHKSMAERMVWKFLLSGVR